MDDERKLPHAEGQGWLKETNGVIGGRNFHRKADNQRRREYQLYICQLSDRTNFFLANIKYSFGYC